MEEFNHRQMIASFILMGVWALGVLISLLAGIFGTSYAFAGTLFLIAFSLHLDSGIRQAMARKYGYSDSKASKIVSLLTPSLIAVTVLIFFIASFVPGATWSGSIDLVFYASLLLVLFDGAIQVFLAKDSDSRKEPEAKKSNSL